MVIDSDLGQSAPPETLPVREPVTTACTGRGGQRSRPRSSKLNRVWPASDAPFYDVARRNSRHRQHLASCRVRVKFVESVRDI